MACFLPFSAYLLKEPQNILINEEEELNIKKCQIKLPKGKII